MRNASRDLSLDYLKGFSCFMMTIAHLPVFDKSDAVTAGIHYFAEYVTVVFYAVSGINTLTQARKYSLHYLLLLNLALFIFGTPYSLTIHANLYARYVLEILQIIALGSMAVALTYRVCGDRRWVFAVLGLTVIALKILRDVWWPEFHGAGVLFVHEGYIPREQLAANDPRIFPGFPIFPWLFAFFWGVFVYQLNQKEQSLLLGVVGLTYVIGEALGILGDFHEKWDTSMAYVLLSMAMLSGSFLLARAVPTHWLQYPRFMPVFGKNSLAFLYVHGFGLLAALAAKSLGQYAGWIIALLVTYGGLRLLEKWRGIKYMENMGAWIAMATLSLLLPVFLLTEPKAVIPVLLINIAIGLLVSRHFNSLRDLLRKLAP